MKDFDWSCYPEHLRPSKPPDGMNAAEIIKTAINVAHAILVHDQSGSGTSFREAEEAAKGTLLGWVVLQANLRCALDELNKHALSLEDDDDKKGILKIICEIERNYGRAHPASVAQA